MYIYEAKISFFFAFLQSANISYEASSSALYQNCLQKIPSTWADSSSKVNIDLDDLGMKKKPQKHSVPMNQMTPLMSMPSTGICFQCS